MHNLSISKFVALLILTPAMAMMSCEKKKDSQDGGSGSGYAIPTLSGSVGAASASNSSLGASHLLNDPANCSTFGGSGSAPQVTCQIAASFFQIAREADRNACIVKALVDNGAVVADGSEYVLTDDSFAAKFTATTNAGAINNFTIHVCEPPSQGQNFMYIGGQVDGSNNATVTMMYKGANANPAVTGMQVYVQVAGLFQGGIWESKSVTMKSQSSSDPAFITQSMVQGPNSCTVEIGINDTTASSGTTPGTGDIRVKSKFILLGNSATTYAIDAGSASASFASASALSTSWTDGGATGGSQFLSDVTGGSSAISLIDSLSSTEVISGSTAQVWDCGTAGKTVVTTSQLSAGAINAFNACLQ